MHSHHSCHSQSNTRSRLLPIIFSSFHLYFHISFRSNCFWMVFFKESSLSIELIHLIWNLCNKLSIQIRSFHWRSLPISSNFMSLWLPLLLLNKLQNEERFKKRRWQQKQQQEHIKRTHCLCILLYTPLGISHSPYNTLFVVDTGLSYVYHVQCIVLLNGYTSCCCCCCLCCCWNSSNWQLHTLEAHTAYINIRVNIQELVTLYRRTYILTHGGFSICSLRSALALLLFLCVNHQIYTEIVYYKRVVCAWSIHTFFHFFFGRFLFPSLQLHSALIYCLMQLYSFTSTFFHLSRL